MSFKKIKVITFDFDGVLVDSYTIIPKVYRDIGRTILGIMDGRLERFVRDMLEGEELLDLGFLGPRAEWWPLIIRRYVNGKPIDIKKIDRYYWEKRISGSYVIEGVKETLETLRENGFELYIMCSRDDKNGSKMSRIKASGLDKYFKDIFLVGENVESRVKALDLISRREGVEKREILVVDDKVPPLYEVMREGVITAKVDFQGPLKKAWMLPIRTDIRIKKIKDLLDILLKE